MSKMYKQYELLDLTGAIGASTALSFGNTERANVQVDLVNAAAGTTTVVVSGTNATTSTGTYVTIGTVTSTTTAAGSKSEVVEINAAYRFVKAACTAIATTGSTVAANIITQGAGY